MIDKKALDVMLIDVRDITTLTDYFIICTSESDPQTRAIFNHIKDNLTAKNGEERHFGIAGGTEYTIYGLRETTSDLGIIVEYTFDDRNDFAFNNEGV